MVLSLDNVDIALDRIAETLLGLHCLDCILARFDQIRCNESADESTEKARSQSGSGS